MERWHNAKFHPYRIIRHHRLSMFTFLFTLVYLIVYLESGGRFKFELKFGFRLKCFLQKCLGSPCYLIVVSGGSFLLGGLNKDTRRCFLQCLQASSILSLLFNIELWSAVRITSFSVMHRLHEQPPLENGWLLLNQYSSVSPLSNGVSDLAW